MCGIAGILGHAAGDFRNLVGMCDSIRHRGSDDAGYAFFGGRELKPEIFGDPDTPPAVLNANLAYTPRHRVGGQAAPETRIALGHRRLAILDLSPSGHQPMSHSGGRFWITYNGEIYNYAELRSELEAGGHCFTTRSDTEIVLAAYAEWGADCLRRFNGMWSLAILDRNRRTLFLARDRFGEKPLYYWTAPDGSFAFASEIKQFSTLPGWKARANGQRTYDFLAWGVTDHTDETLFERVFQLPPGNFAELPLDNLSSSFADAGRIHSTSWYRLTLEPFSGSFESACTEFLHRLQDSIRLRLHADVQVDFALSGGLDSSSVVCVAGPQHGAAGATRPKTFSICSDDSRYDERSWSDRVSEACGTERHYIYPCAERLFEQTRTIVWHQDEPIGSAAIHAQWCMFQAAHQTSTKVMLGGSGSDEQLAGYYSFYGPLLAGLLRRGSFAALAKEFSAVRQLNRYGRSQLLRTLISSTVHPFLKDPLRRILRKPIPSDSWLDAKRLGAVQRDPFHKTRRDNQFLSGFSRTCLTRAPLPMVLHWEDRNSMAHSIESRAPFLDYRLVEFSLGLPDEFKIQNGKTKRVLRESMQGILPEAVRTRTGRIGLATSEEFWLKGSLRTDFEKQLDDAQEVCEGFLTPRGRAEIENVLAGAVPFNFLPWRMVSFGQWARMFKVSFG